MWGERGRTTKHNGRKQATDRQDASRAGGKGMRQDWRGQTGRNKREKDQAEGQRDIIAGDRGKKIKYKVENNRQWKGRQLKTTPRTEGRRLIQQRHT